MRKYRIITLLSFCVLLKINAEVFSSIAKMELLITTQKSVIDSLNNLINVKNIRNRFLENHLRRFELEHREAAVDKLKYLKNPINCFRLIKRLTVDFKSIKDELNGSDFIKNESLTYPTEIDLKGSTGSILRLMQTYGLDTRSISSGLWNTSYGSNGTFIETFNPMTISDCYELGRAMCGVGYYNHGIKWLKEALDKFNYERMKYPEDEKITLEDISHEIVNGSKRYRFTIKKFSTWIAEIAVLLPNVLTFNPKLVMDSFQKELTPLEAVKVIVTKNKSVEYTSAVDNVKVNDLCKGIDKRNTMNKDMKCYLAHGPHPFLKLSPIKAEVLHRTPIILFYDVIRENEIEHLKSNALPELNRANVGYNTITNGRVCQTGFASSNDTVTARVRTRIEDFTGLKLAFSECLQVANYGIAGHYVSHHDYWFDCDIAKKGNRIATAVLYLSNVEQGGATVFSELGLSVFPVKGAVLFWMNLSNSSAGNPLTLHAACPVLWGSKWVATQWVNLRGQELNMPCRFDGKNKVWSYLYTYSMVVPRVNEYTASRK